MARTFNRRPVIDEEKLERKLRKEGRQRKSEAWAKHVRFLVEEDMAEVEILGYGAVKA